MSRCRTCNSRLRCLRCLGRAGGRVPSPERLAALARARTARWRWVPGDRVMAKAKAERVWEAEVVAIGPGRRGRRGLTLRVTRHPRAAASGLSVPYESIVPESQVVRCPRGQEERTP